MTGPATPKDGLRRLLEQATPGPWGLEYDTYEKYVDMPSVEDSRWVWRIEKVCDFANEEGSEADARLVAFAPEMAALLCDMAARIPVWGQGMTDTDWRDADALLARFRALDEKAGQP